MPRINPTSAIRSGFEYQDFWGLKLSGEWLADPNLYKWIQFETSPDEIDVGRFYLDDIILLGADNLHRFYQVKHRQDSADQWTWDDFLTARREKGTSIFRKWAQSLLPRLHNTKQAFFVTNGQASKGIALFLDRETIDVNRIKDENEPLFGRIKSEIGSEQEVALFFEKLRFLFGQKDAVALEEEICHFLNSSLYATKSGIDNLLRQIHKECLQQITRRLDIDTIRQWCEFDNPRPLNEQFEIPEDFEFFDDKEHQEMLGQLLSPQGGIRVVFGKPGVGKSVYLSKLDAELQKLGKVSIKHHYHISPADSNPQERLNSGRVIEAIKAQFKGHREELGAIAQQNSKNIPLNDFIKTVADNVIKKNSALVIIIDGLDHALRYGAKQELETFLREICLPQPGVWIVIGMQLIAKPHLPQIVFDKCPESDWVEIKGLNKAGVASLIRANSCSLHLPDHTESLNALIGKLYAITAGNPLHLRYSLKQLKNLSGTLWLQSTLAMISFPTATT